MWPHLPLTQEREVRVRAAFAELAPRAGLELRLGFELTPNEPLLHEDLRRYVLAGTDCILIEVPFWVGYDMLLLVAAHAVECGLRPVIAHPERSDEVLARPELAQELAAEGWLLQVNGSSLLGRHGIGIRELAWDLVEARSRRAGGLRRPPPGPPAASRRGLRARARAHGGGGRPLFDGTALGLAARTAAA